MTNKDEAAAYFEAEATAGFKFKNVEEFAGFTVWQDDDEHGWWHYGIRGYDHPRGGFETKEMAVKEATSEIELYGT